MARLVPYIHCHHFTMRKLPPMNEYQQLLYCALALVEEADLVAILRAARKHPERNRCIDIANAELDKGIRLWDTFAAPSRLHTLFTTAWPEFRVLVDTERRSIHLDFGTNGSPSDIRSWDVQMGATGVVERFTDVYQYYPEGMPPEPGPKLKGWNPQEGLGLQ